MLLGREKQVLSINVTGIDIAKLLTLGYV